MRSSQHDCAPPRPGLKTSRQTKTAGSGGARSSHGGGWRAALRLQEDQPPQDHGEGRRDPEETPRRGRCQQTRIARPVTQPAPACVYLVGETMNLQVATCLGPGLQEEGCSQRPPSRAAGGHGHVGQGPRSCPQAPRVPSRGTRHLIRARGAAACMATPDHASNVRINISNRLLVPSNCRFWCILSIVHTLKDYEATITY